MINLFENVINEDVLDNLSMEQLETILAMFGENNE